MPMALAAPRRVSDSILQTQNLIQQLQTAATASMKQCVQQPPPGGTLELVGDGLEM